MTSKKRPKLPRGSSLYWDGRRGVYYWRSPDPRTGDRRVRNTEQSRLDLARREAAKFEDEFREELAGIKRLDHWREPLLPLAEEWFAELRDESGNEPKTLRQRENEVRRALARLHLKIAADLTDLRVIARRLKALVSKGLVTRCQARRSYQVPLKQFSRWLAQDQNYLDRDPLALWKAVRVPVDPDAGRSTYYQEEIARTLAALDVLDDRLGRAGRQRVMFTTLLVAGGPRIESFLALDVADFDPVIRRLDLGPGKGRKRTGDGALDPTTTREIEANLGGRESGPLFLSPWGVRWPKKRALEVWRQALSLAAVDALWPTDEPRSLDLAIQVSRALQTKRVKVGRGGNPKRLKPETVSARLDLERLVRRIADRLRESWEAWVTDEGTDRMKDVHQFRTTHETWAMGAEVPGHVIDKQLGHHGGRSRRAAEVRRVAASRTGRAHYTDMSQFDAERSARAVRQLLEEAEVQLRGTPSMLFGRDRQVGDSQATA